MNARGLGAQLLDVLFPPRCQLCGALCDEPLCETCKGKLLFIHGAICPCCGKPVGAQIANPRPGLICRDCRDGRWLSGVRSVGLHTGALRDAMIAYKFHARTRLVEPFARWLGDVFEREVGSQPRGLPLERCSAVIPVPLHPKRRRWRGFDQAELLCERMAKDLEAPVATDVLIRVRHTTPQTRLRGRSRRQNVRGAFEAPKPWRLKKRSFLLVDDVMTTGATLEECARVLRPAGAAGVYALTVTRAENSVLLSDAPKSDVAGGTARA